MSAPLRRISHSAVRRLSAYLRALEGFEAEGTETVSSGELARRAGTTAAQVRKDLSTFGSFGKRGLGYPVSLLRGNLAGILGLTREWRVALIGAGRIGSALHAYPFFRERGFLIVAIFDEDPAKIGRRWGGTPIRPVTEFEQTIEAEGIDLAILAVPAEAAPTLGARAAAAGIRGILNFAPVRLELPPEVEVNDVNLAMEMEALSFALERGRDR